MIFNLCLVFLAFISDGSSEHQESSEYHKEMLSQNEINKFLEVSSSLYFDQKISSF